MKRVTLIDYAAGNALGWDPGGVNTIQNIEDPALTADSVITVNVNEFGIDICHTLGLTPGLPMFFSIRCSPAAIDGSTLRYTLTNLPFS